MGRKKSPGLVKRGGVWHIEKRVQGYGRIRESCRTSSLQQAEEYLAHRLDLVRQQVLFGVRPTRTFKQAATKYLNEHQHKRSIKRDAQDLPELTEFIGDLSLEQVHMGTLQPFIDHRLKTVTIATVNRTLAMTRRILNLAARMWRHDNGLTWLQQAPLIQLLPNPDARRPYPLSFEEQALLFGELPDHLARMALFKVNTGTREQEVVRLSWEWEYDVPELDTTVFIVPGGLVKNGQDRLVVLNRVAKSVIASCRGNHPKRVFTWRGRSVTKMYNSGWLSARQRATDRYEATFGRACPDGFKRLRVHDLKHAFGRRLRSCGVSFEDRQDLLGHKSHRITTHYSSAEIGNLIAAAERVCARGAHKMPTMTTLRPRLIV